MFSTKHENQRFSYRNLHISKKGMAIIMILDIEIKNRLSEYLKLMESVILIKLSAGDDSVSKNIIALVDELFLEFMPELKADIDPL